MSKFDYGQYDVRRAGHQEDLRERSSALSDAKTDAYNAMIKLILEHKKEITKVPAATTYAGATEWAKKHPGFRATLEDIGGDAEKEVVVFDKAGNPFMINGYKLKPSDYGVRKAYWDANPTAEHRAANPMRQWAQDYVWSTQVDEKNPWKQSVTKNFEAYDKMKAWGYRMPSKPKTELSPYSIFSKLIAPIVKEVITGQGLIEKINRRPPVVGVSQAGAANCEFIRRLISPISLYRYLYLRLVEQKFFWSLYKTPEKRHFATSYERFKRYLKENKKTFRGWFEHNVLNKENLAEFNENWVNVDLVLDNLVKNDIDWNGRDIQDGLVYLIGVNTLNENVMTDGSQKVAHLICNNQLAANFLNQLADKSHTNHKNCKKLMEKIKKLSQQSIDVYLKSDAVRKHMFEDQKGFNTFENATREGHPNSTDPQSVRDQKQKGVAPGSPPVVRDNKPTMRQLSDDEPAADDDDPFASYRQHMIDEEQLKRWVQEAEAEGVDPQEYIKSKIEK